MRVEDLEFEVQGLGLRVRSSGFRIQGEEITAAVLQYHLVQGAGCEIQKSRVQDSVQCVRV